MDSQKLFDKIINKLDEAYELYLLLDSSPKGVIVKKKINNKEYNYLQYRLGKKIKSTYIQSDQLENIKEILKIRKKLEKEFKNKVEVVTKYIKTLKIYNRELYLSAKEELSTFKLDIIPTYKKLNFKFSPLVQSLEGEGKPSLLSEEELTSLMQKWVKNEIRLRDIEKVLISKFIS